jgi:hypothetical protein
MFNYPSAGEGHVPAYQVSAVPFVTSSTLAANQTQRIDFGFLTRFLLVKNNTVATTKLAVGFTANGMKPAMGNFFILSGSESMNVDIRVTSVYLSSSQGLPGYSLIAGLTGIPTVNAAILTGSSGFPGVG